MIRSIIAVLVSLVVVAGPPSVSGPVAAEAGGMTLTILHSNDASSQLLNAGEGLADFGGVARFKALVDHERVAATIEPDGIVIVLSAGNTIEVGPNLQASLERRPPSLDAMTMRAIGYDAAGLGDQDFGLGPDVLADLMCGTVQVGGGENFAGCGVTGRAAFPFLAANLNFAADVRLQEFAEAGGLAGSTIVTKGAHRIGVVGVTTPLLPVISSPGSVTVMSNTAGAVQAEVDALQDQGVEVIIVVAALGGIDEEVALAKTLSGVDVIVSGGNGTLMANPGDLLVPGDRPEAGMTYPIYATDKQGVPLPIVTTAGGYRYVGKLVIELDAEGKVVRVRPDSGPIRVAGERHEDGVKADPILANAIEEPLRAFLDSLASDIVATAEVALDGRPDAIRARETNLGDLMADAALWKARELAGELEVASADVAILNAGAMRLETLREAGPLSRLATYEIAPFASFISVVEDVTPARLKLLMENTLSQLPQAEARFGQIAGFGVTYDPDRSAGDRVVSIQLDGGTHLVQGGTIVPGAPSVTVATGDFLARGGDEYPFSSAFTSLGVTYQQALESYVSEALGGVISASDYPEGGEGRIVAQ
jgi:2',3'-cyclic-nucleotide 2'-phosphodiesterase (5'-nucleotidase family)